MPKLYLCVIAAWIVVKASAAAAYLPAIGPSPLRFLAPPKCVSSPTISLVDIKPTGTTNASVFESIGSDASLASIPPTNLVLSDSTNLTATSPEPERDKTFDGSLGYREFGLVGGASGSVFVPPQNMAHFFQCQLTQTNALRRGVVFPFIFVPPVPGEKHPSKSVYSFSP